MRLPQIYHLTGFYCYRSIACKVDLNAVVQFVVSFIRDLWLKFLLFTLELKKLLHMTSCNHSTKDGYSADRAHVALFIACHYGHAHMVEYLISLGMNTRKCMPSGKEAIVVAATRGHIRCTELIRKLKVSWQILLIFLKNFVGEHPISP